jgi:hypothetical protein
MPLTIDSWFEENADQIAADLPIESRLKGLKPEDRLKGLKPEDRLKGLKPEDRLKGLSKDQIKKLVEKYSSES